MSRKKDWEALAPRTKSKYMAVLESAFGKKVPSYVPDYSDWPESMRAILRAAMQAYWHARGDEAKGIILAKKITHGRTLERAVVWPTIAQGTRFLAEAERTEPRAAFLLVKLCCRRGWRIEELCSTSRPNWVAGVRWGRLKVVGKGNKERVLVVGNVTKTIEELLSIPAHPPHDRSVAHDPEAKWNFPGETLARLGSSFETHRNLISRYMKRVAETAGLDPEQWHPHTLRHVFSDRYLANGGTERKLQEALGHASAETLRRYTHPSPESVGEHFEGD